VRGPGAASNIFPEELKQFGGFEWTRLGPKDPGASVGTLPDWELDSLHKNLAPETWSPPSEWYYQIKDGIETKPHRLDVWLAKVFDVASTQRKQAADALRNAPTGAWVRLPHRIATLYNGQVHHSNMVPPLRMKRPYGGAMPGPATLPQIAGFHGTSLDGALGAVNSPFWTMRGGAGSHDIRRKYAEEFPVTHFAPSFSWAACYADGHPAKEVPGGPSVVVVLEVYCS
jgi:hypothetical protein